MIKIHTQLKKLLKQYKSSFKTKIKLVEDIGISNVLFDNMLDPKYSKRIQPNKEKHVRRRIDELLNKT